MTATLSVEIELESTIEALVQDFGFANVLESIAASMENYNGPFYKNEIEGLNKITFALHTNDY